MKRTDRLIDIGFNVLNKSDMLALDVGFYGCICNNVWD